MFRVRSASGEELLPRVIAVLHGNIERERERYYQQVWQPFSLCFSSYASFSLLSPLLSPPESLQLPSPKQVFHSGVKGKQSNTWV